MNSQLSGVRALITGGAGGIGAALCEAFAAEGAHVLVHAHQHITAARELSAGLPGGPHVAVQADLRDERAVDDMFAAAGPLDVLIVNAGVWPHRDVAVVDMSLAQWQNTLAVNVAGAFLCARGFLRALRTTPRPTPAIVLIGSTAALFGEAGHADYAASKAALVFGLLPTLKNEIVELAPQGRVNAVCPGWTETPLTAPALADGAVLARATRTMPLRTVAQPGDIAAAAVFLASPVLAGHISGAVLPVAGGMEGRLLWPE